MWDRDWKPLLIVVPLSLVKPIISIVSFMWNCLCDRIKTISCQYEDTLYAAEQAGPPFGCVVTWVGITNERLAKCVVHDLQHPSIGDSFKRTVVRSHTGLCNPHYQ